MTLTLNLLILWKIFSPPSKCALVRCADIFHLRLYVYIYVYVCVCYLGPDESSRRRVWPREWLPASTPPWGVSCSPWRIYHHSGASALPGRPSSAPQLPLRLRSSSTRHSRASSTVAVLDCLLSRYDHLVVTVTCDMPRVFRFKQIASKPTLLARERRIQNSIDTYLL